MILVLRDCGFRQTWMALAETYGFQYRKHRACSELACAFGASFKNIVYELRIRFEVEAALLNGSEFLDDGVGKPAFALDATDAGGCTALAHSLLHLFGGKDPVQIKDGADVGVAGIGAADARRVGDHGLELGAHDILRIREQDGVAVALGHLAAVGTRKLGAGSKQNLRLWKNLRCDLVLRDLRHKSLFVRVCVLEGWSGLRGVELVEAARNLARQLNVGHLVG